MRTMSIKLLKAVQKYKIAKKKIALLVSPLFPNLSKL